jgi:hypothetical protein
MSIHEKTCAAVAAMILITAPAMAQTPYVGTALVGDVARFSHSSFDGRLGESSGGEAIGFALRLGIGVGAAWGVEAEFARPSELTSTASPPVLAALGYPELVGRLGLIDPGGLTGLGISIDTRQRNTTLSTVAWVRQDLTNRAALVYLGGLSFVRAAHVTEYSFSFVRALPGLLLPAADRVEFIAYGVRPVVGIEARIGLTDHLELVPGVRLTGLESGWLVRPAVGLSWGF